MTTTTRFTFRITLCLIALFALTQTMLFAGETWDKTKTAAKNLKLQTELKMMKSKYKGKIEDEYTRLGQAIYADPMLQEKLMQDKQCADMIKKITLMNKKIDKADATLKAIDAGEEVTKEDLDDIEQGIGLEEDTTTKSSTDDSDKEKDKSPTPAPSPQP